MTFGLPKPATGSVGGSSSPDASTVKLPFSVHVKLKLDYLWAGLCILGAVYFIFRSRWIGG